MSAVVDIGHEREWTPDSLEEFLAEPRDPELHWRNFQIVDGSLVVSPPPHPRHETALVRLGALLLAASPAGFEPMGAAGIVVGRSYLVSDVTVVAEQVVGQPRMRVAPADVLLVVEIESPSSRTMDRLVKMAEYARAGILFYWRIEFDPLRLIAYSLVSDTYTEVGSWSAGETVSLTQPFPVEFEVSSLLPR